MSVMMRNGLQYAGVPNESLMQKIIPNPTGTPTDILSTVSIDGTIFVIKGIPDNAYLLNEVEGLPSDIATFADGSALPMPSLKVGIKPIQEGSGDPSPTNIRPISGHTEANVVVSPTTDTEDGTTYNIQFKDRDNPLTVYGGSLDVVSGVLTVDRASVTYLDSTGFANHSSSDRWYHEGLPSGADYSKRTQAISNSASYQDTYLDIMHNYGALFAFGSSGVYVNKLDSEETIEQFNARLQANPMQICYELANPQTYQLTPTQVKSLLGTNNVWADTGDIEELEYFSKEA